MKVKTFSFIDAITEMLNGSKIKRAEWGNADYCLIKDGFFMIFREESKKFHQWIISDGDYLAGDWYLIPVN